MAYKLYLNKVKRREWMTKGRYRILNDKVQAIDLSNRYNFQGPKRILNEAVMGSLDSM